jgi:hypothetical protein
MVQKKIIPDAYTTYEDGHLGVIPASLANVEAKIGAALGGTPGRVYTLAGPDAKKQAKTVFKGGPLLQALEEAFDAGSSRIHAVRIGQPVQAALPLKDAAGTDTLKLKGDYGASGNNHYVSVMHQFENVKTGVGIVVSGNPHKAAFYDEQMVKVREVELAQTIASVVGIGVQALPFATSGKPGFWILGVGPAPASHPMAWHYDSEEQLVPADTLDFNGKIPPGDTVTGIVSVPMGGPGTFIEITTDKHLLFFEIPQPGTAVLAYSLAYADCGIANPAVSSVVHSYDFNALWRGEEPKRTALVLDRTAKKIYALDESNDVLPELIGELDFAAWAGPDFPEGIAVDLATGDVLVAFRTAADPVDRVTRLRIDWEADPDPTAEEVETKTVMHNVYGLGEYVHEAQVATTLTVQDRNVTPWAVYQYQGTAAFDAVTQAVADAVNDDGTYLAELHVDEPLLLAPSAASPGGPPAPTQYAPFTDGADGGDLTNADYLAGLDATTSRIDTAWIHAVGAVTTALWNAILVHCAEMFEKHQAERFAILECPDFESTAEVGSAAYLEDLQAYVDGIVAMASLVADRNAVVFAGGSRFLGSDGLEYIRSVTSACGGTMARLEVQKSLINKPVRNALRLVPEFGQAHLESLIQARVNCLRFKPGRGFIIAHSLTAAAPGSDYSRVNDLRAVYYGAKAAREAAQPYVGEENDTAGEGLRRLESAMSRPLESMRDNGQIDAFDLTAVSTAQDRLLGDVYVSLGIQPRRAMEMIYTTVYLK